MWRIGKLKSLSRQQAGKAFRNVYMAVFILF
jgi:hypothetical protein